ncbi:uncharacterized protein J3D65DRAFT_160707 [Phyllosticta citribraziliensis]|uniref:Uncharacterized protein n=1 Tax=Phyllosticta citribraziliensis TaxID=989973 RepID=A0ABR1L5G0_9PEZI
MRDWSGLSHAWHQWHWARMAMHELDDQNAPFADSWWTRSKRWVSAGASVSMASDWLTGGPWPVAGAPPCLQNGPCTRASQRRGRGGGGWSWCWWLGILHHRISSAPPSQVFSLLDFGLPHRSPPLSPLCIVLTKNSCPLSSQRAAPPPPLYSASSTLKRSTTPKKKRTSQWVATFDPHPNYLPKPPGPIPIV